MPHINELIDFTAGAFIVNNSKVLLVFHKKLRIWTAPGGHIELDEDPNQAAVREVKEETGLDIELIGGQVAEEINTDLEKSLIPPLYLDIHHFNEKHRHIGFVYFAKVSSNEVRLLESEHDDIKWFNEEDLDNPQFKLLKSIRFYSKEALRRLSD